MEVLGNLGVSQTLRGYRLRESERERERKEKEWSEWWLTGVANTAGMTSLIMETGLVIFIIR